MLVTTYQESRQERRGRECIQELTESDEQMLKLGEKSQEGGIWEAGDVFESLIGAHRRRQTQQAKIRDEVICFPVH
ncbi:hypothetical protein Baya_6236 [Bagarius yarrelli]|uniref:Uncharacterized protein n=1 Tax=Bagarius yarrelli TaxID=175774 RepID=A0A556U010_BAGYA|nr:hypothetical protein Baya_6236 [Bagarius yarrelli]